MNSRPVKRVEDVCRLRAAQFSEDAGETHSWMMPAGSGCYSCRLPGSLPNLLAARGRAAVFSAQCLGCAALQSPWPPGPSPRCFLDNNNMSCPLPPTGPMAHPIRPESYIKMDNFYTLTVYEKGEELVFCCFFVFFLFMCPCLERLVDFWWRRWRSSRQLRFRVMHAEGQPATHLAPPCPLPPSPSPRSASPPPCSS
jgi:hypothetical protein